MDKDKLHAAIMNLPAGVPPVPDQDRLLGSAEVLWSQGYRVGHRDARHAAAELVSACESVCQGAVRKEPEPDAREQFERWYVGALVTQGAREIERDALGQYILLQTRLSWQAWHAGWLERSAAVSGDAVPGEQSADGVLASGNDQQEGGA